MSGFTTSLASPITVEAEDSLAITFAPLSLEEVYALADAPGNGAVVVMSGTVRNQTDAPIWKKEHWEDGSSSWVSIGACETQEGV